MKSKKVIEDKSYFTIVWIDKSLAMSETAIKSSAFIIGTRVE